MELEEENKSIIRVAYKSDNLNVVIVRLPKEFENKLVKITPIKQ